MPRRQPEMSHHATIHQDEQNNRLKGTIKNILHAQGYGFITHTATGEDYFFHRSVIAPDAEQGFADLVEDQRVEFSAVEGPKGKRADSVWPL